MLLCNQWNNNKTKQAITQNEKQHAHKEMCMIKKKFTKKKGQNHRKKKEFVDHMKGGGLRLTFRVFKHEMEEGQ